MTGSRGVSATDGALLEVSLQNVTAREGVAAEDAHVWAVTSVSQKVALQVLCVQVRLGAVWAGELAISILGWNHGGLCSIAVGGHRRSTGSAGEYASTTLRANDVGRRLHVIWHHHAALSIARLHAPHGMQSVGRHGTEGLGHPTLSWSGGDGLGMRHGRGRLWHHRGRRPVWLWLLRLLIVAAHHLVPTVLRTHLSIVTHGVGVGGVGRGWSARRVRRAATAVQ